MSGDLPVAHAPDGGLAASDAPASAGGAPEVTAVPLTDGAAGGRTGSLAPVVDDGRGSRLSALYGALLALWVAGVVFTAMHHEFWRDEVRALSRARDAGSLPDLVRVIENEGHPVVWYALLYIGNAIVETPLVLPVISILVGAAAVAVFLWRAPFPSWFKAGFIFGALPFYEYAVMARNYGISMLLLFAAAALYRRRREHPFALAVTLGLLANTNAHSVVLALLLAGVWAWDAIAESGSAAVRALGRTLYLPLGIVALGVLLSVVTVTPTSETIVTRAGTTGAGELLQSLVTTSLRPAQQFREVVPDIPGPVDQLLPYLAALGLLIRMPLFLAALAAQAGLSLLFDVIYPGSYRHQGLYLVFLLTLYWIAIETPDRARTLRHGPALLRVGLFGAVLALLVTSLLRTPEVVLRDLRTELSAAPALGAYLRHSDAYRDAVIVAEPGYLAEALPYYAPNRIYLPRERRFGSTATFTTHSRAELSMGELLEIAREVQAGSARPVLLVLGHWGIDDDSTHRRRIAYGRWFTWTDEQRAEWRRSTRPVGEFRAGTGDESFRVFALRTPTGSGGTGAGTDAARR